MSAFVKFHAISADPKDASGIATYAVNNLAVNVPIASLSHAMQLAAFIDEAVKQASKSGRRAAIQAMRGLANNLEADGPTA